jgi:hypothetical protein
VFTLEELDDLIAAAEASYAAEHGFEVDIEARQRLRP